GGFAGGLVRWPNQVPATDAQVAGQAVAAGTGHADEVLGARCGGETAPDHREGGRLAVPRAAHQVHRRATGSLVHHEPVVRRVGVVQVDDRLVGGGREDEPDVPLVGG